MQQPNFMSRGNNGPPVPPATPSEGGHGPPITKKQRGGQTPISIRQQRERPSSRGRDRIPPPTTGVGLGLGSGGGPPGGAGDVGAVIDEGISRRRAELRRLQEKSKRQRNAMNKSSPREQTSATLSSTVPPLSNTTALSQPPPPIPIRPAVASLRHQSDLFPSVPKSPSVPKETVNNEESQIAAFANASTFNKGNNHDGKKAAAAVAEGGVGPPSMSMPSTGTGTSIPAFESTTSTTKSMNPNPNLPPPTPSVGNLFSPTPAAVGRRLEFPSSIKPPSASSPKKDPPVPPTSSASGTTLPPIRGGSGAPPPPSIRRTTQGPPTPIRKTTPTRSRSKSPAPSGSSSRGKKTSTTTKATTSTAAAPDSVFEMRRRLDRAKSAPPARPPLPSGPPPPPKGSPATRAWAKKKMKARGKARSRSSGRHRPKPVIVSPGSLKLEGAKETTAKDTTTTATTAAANSNTATATTTTTKKFASGIPPPSRSPIKELVNNNTSKDNTNNVVGGNTGIGMGVMDTSKTSAPITTTTTTPTTTTTTPTTFLQINQTSIYDKDGKDDDVDDEDGQKTPPSTGSSARRQKLQLMREQAGALGAISATTAVDVIGAGPLATAALAAAAAAGAPSITAAFAAATEAVSNNNSNSTISGVTTTTNNIASGPPPSKTLTATTTATATAGLPPPGSKSSDALPPPGRVAGSSSAAAAAAPPPTSSSLRNESQIRLEEVYAKSEREKTAAFLKVKELELLLTTKIDEEFERAVQQKKQRHAPAPAVVVAAVDEGGVNVEEFVQLAETQGSEAALQWVKQQQPQFLSPKAGSSMGVGFTSPPPTTHNGTMTPTTSRRRIASRALTPHPIRHKIKMEGDRNNPPSPEMETPEEVERRLIHQFREAVQYVPHEFSTAVANFTIRRPYGMDGPGRPEPGHEHEQANHNNSVQLFQFVTPPEEPFEAYSRRAHVSSKASIEVVAVVKADNSPFLLFNAAGVRYKTNPYSQDEPFVHIDNVDMDVDRPLGHITYRDAQTGREREYSLDEILEEALIVRENYCGTLTSIALRLEENDGQAQQAQQQQHPVQDVQIPGRDLDLHKAPSKDVGVETDEQGMLGPETSSPSEQQEAEVEDDDAGSSDVLVVFIGMMFSAFFKLFVGLVVGLPLRVVRSIVVWTISYLLIQYVLLYCMNATGYHEWILAVNNDPVNPFQFHLTKDDFISHTNRPGIM